MKIGINLLWLLPGLAGGTETHVRGLIGGLTAIDRSNDYVLFTNRENHEQFENCGANFVRELCDFSALSRSQRILREQILLPGRASRAGLDVLHSPGYTMPLAARCGTVVTIHDCNAWAVPQSVRGSRRPLLKLLTKASARRAEAILTVSEFSAKEIIQRLRVSPAKVFVVHNAPKPRLRLVSDRWTDLARRLGISSEYIVAFSSADPHKNIDGLIRAFARLPMRENWQLVLLGHHPENSVSPRRLAEALGIGELVLTTGYLTDSKVQLALEHAHVMAFPSLYEGFGIPVLEAMAAGVPVVCSARGALPEVAGNAALYFDPSAPDQMAAALWKAVADQELRKRLIAAGYANVRRYSWECAARGTLEVYKRVVEARSRHRPDTPPH